MVRLPKGKAGRAIQRGVGFFPVRLTRSLHVPFPVTATQLLLASQALIRILRLGTCLLGRSFWKIVLHILDRLMNISDPLHGGAEPLTVSQAVSGVLAPPASPGRETHSRAGPRIVPFQHALPWHPDSVPSCSAVRLPCALLSADLPIQPC